MCDRTAKSLMTEGWMDEGNQGDDALHKFVDENLAIYLQIIHISFLL